MIRIPAIDLRAGRVVRLRQGDYAAETRYASDPVELALRYAEEGASHLHLVDLDAARAGVSDQRDLMAAMARESGLQVQAGGGVRAREDILALLDAGMSRVVIGSLAVRAPDLVLAWAEEFGADRILVALDARADATGIYRLPVAGWTEATSLRLQERLQQFVAGGLQDFLCTDIERDGMLSGPNIDLYRDLQAQFPSARFQASGGLSSLEDLRALADSGCAAVVMGRALLEGRFTLAEALSC
jgi:phosphoribosylformimino-5-aminoimidazole carboxamide ribotide isomerase